MRALPWVALLLFASPLAAEELQTPFEREDVTAVAAQLACYCGCPHMQVSSCFCGTADSIREDIAKHLDAGGTPEDYVAGYVAEHGTWGLAVPPKEGFNLLVWLLPGLLLLAGGGIVFWIAWRLTHGPPPLPVQTADVAPSASEPRDEELDELLREGD